MMDQESFEILSTNLPGSFWHDVQRIIRQNRRGALEKFLFSEGGDRNLENRIKSLEDKLLWIEEKILKLEKYHLRELSDSLESKKDLNQIDSTLDKNKLKFKPPGQLEPEDKLEIIQRGFELQEKEKISLKGFYEREGINTLFEWKHFKIKYDSIRKDDLYKQLKNKDF